MAASETSQRLQLARDLQRSLSPEVMPRLEGYELAAYSQPAELVGGDCYDVNLNGRLNLLIADATGHGLSAAVYMARTQAYLRSGLAAGQRLEEVLVEVNRRLVAERNFRMFATVVCAQLDPVARLLRYARAGHNPPFLVRGQQVEALESGAGPLGLFKDFHLQGSAVELEEGDVLVLYTDGLIEALNAQREQFTEERLIALLLSQRDAPAQGLLDGIVDAVNDFIGAAPQEDDITVAVLRVGPVGGGPSPAPSRLLIGGERRPVALGFVRLGQVDEGVRSAVETQLDQLVTARQAVWKRLSEEAFLTVFGAPVIHEDDAARSLETLSALRSQVRSSAGVELRAGLHVGQVVLKPDGGVEYSLIGEALNRAFELEGLAGPGQLLLSDELRHLAGAYLDLSEALLEVEGAGLAYALQEIPLGRIEHWQRAEWTETTPYVEREAELQRLSACWRECTRQRSGRPRLIGIRGEAGLGKSRLLREFERLLRQTHPQCKFLRGRAQPYGNQPYVLFSSLIQDYLRMVQPGEGEWRAALEKELEDLGARLPAAEQEALREAGPLIGYLIGVKYEDPRLRHLDAPGLQREVQLAMREFAGRIIRRAGSSPVILLEDLHWVDAASLHLLHFLLEGLELPAPPLVVATYREPSEGLKGYEELVLAPLGRAAGEALARAILGERGLPEPALHLWVERAAGNPLFLEEFAQVFLRQETLAQPASVQAQEIPDTLRGLLLAQMDQLEATTRQVAQMAAVLGQEFEGALLRRMAEKARLAPGLLQVGIEALAGAGVVFFQGESTGRFKHALIQDAAYETLLPGDRQVLHGFAAEAIEELCAETIDLHVYALAHHCLQGQQQDKALHYICLALRQAFISADTERGLSLAEQGLELVGQVADRKQAQVKLEILRKRRDTYTLRDEFDQAHADNEAIIALGQRFDDEWVAEAHAFGDWIYRKAGDLRKAEQSALRALEFQDRVSDPAVLGKIFHHAGEVKLHRGEYDQAIEYYQRAIILLERAGEHSDLGVSHMTSGHAYLRKYDLHQAEFHYQQALKIFQAIGERIQILGICDLLGNCRFLAGDLEGSIRYHLQALQENIPFGKNWIFLIITTNLAQCYYEAGQEEQAERYYQECLQQARTLGIQDIVLGQLYSLCRLYAEQEQPEGWAKAVQMADEALAIAGEIGYPGGRILGLSGKAMALVRLGRIQEACRVAEEAVTLLESQGKVGGNHEEGLLEERILFEHYQVLSAAGRRAKGRPYLRRARDGLMALAEAVGEEHRGAVLRNLKFHRELAVAWEA